MITRIEYFVSNRTTVAKIIPVWPGFMSEPMGCYFLGTNGRFTIAASTSGAAGDGGSTSGNQTSPVKSGAGSLKPRNVSEADGSLAQSVYVRRTDGSCRRTRPRRRR